MSFSLTLFIALFAVAFAGGPMHRRYKGCSPSTTTTTGTTGTTNPMIMGPGSVTAVYAHSCNDFFMSYAMLSGSVPASFIQSMMPPRPMPMGPPPQGSNMGGQQNSMAGGYPQQQSFQPMGFPPGPPQGGGFGGPAPMGPMLNDSMIQQILQYDRATCPGFKTYSQSMPISQTIINQFQPLPPVTTGQAVPPTYAGPCCDIYCYCDDVAAGTATSNTTQVCGGLMDPPPRPQPGQGPFPGQPGQGMFGANFTFPGFGNRQNFTFPQPPQNFGGWGNTNSILPANPSSFSQNNVGGRDAWGRVVPQQNNFNTFGKK